jgi:hypothetical protein
MKRTNDRSNPLHLKTLLLDLLDRAYNKISWHGANLTSALRGVDAPTAARRVATRKTIWEQALHAAYWKHRVINKLAGKQKFARKGSNWPVMPDPPTEEAWRRDLAFLQETHHRLRAAVESYDLTHIEDKTLRMIHGVAFHDIYHAAQIKLLRRLVK